MARSSGLNHDNISERFKIYATVPIFFQSDGKKCAQILNDKKRCLTSEAGNDVCRNREQKIFPVPFSEPRKKIEPRSNFFAKKWNFLPVTKNNEGIVPQRVCRGTFWRFWSNMSRLVLWGCKRVPNKSSIVKSPKFWLQSFQKI